MGVVQQNLNKEEKENNITKGKIIENVIIGNLEIKRDNLKQRIINSYENFKRENIEEYIISKAKKK